MILAQHGFGFAEACRLNFEAMVELFLKETSKNQRFVLLFEQNGRAFRNACENGEIRIVELLWECATPTQRSQLLRMTNGPLAAATQKAKTEIIDFIWRNIDGTCREQVGVNNWVKIPQNLLRTSRGQ